MADKKQQSEFNVDEFLKDPDAGQAPLPTPPSPGPVQEAIAPVYGAGAAGVGMANDFLSSPLGHMAELGAGGYYGLKKLGQVFGGRGAAGGAAPAPTGPVAPTAATPAPNTAWQNTQQGVNNMIRSGQAAGEAAPVAAENAGMEAGGQRLVDMVKNYRSPNSLGGMLGNMAVLPAALSAPYLGAAYEQAKIRQNPNAAGLEHNPYAQMVRGEYATQGAAGAANRREAIRNQNYGMLTQAEQDILNQDRVDQKIRNAAAQRALRPVAPQMPDNQG